MMTHPIQGLVSKWETIFNLPDSITHYYVPEALCDEGSDTIAETLCNWEYRSASISWFMGKVATLTDVELERAVVHEMTHVLLAPIERHVAKRYTEQAEFAVENTARLIMRIYNENVT